MPPPNISVFGMARQNDFETIREYGIYLPTDEPQPAFSQ